MAAAISTVQSVCKPQEKVCLRVDNQAFYYYLSKAGRKEPFNKKLHPFFRWLLNNQVELEVSHSSRPTEEEGTRRA